MAETIKERWKKLDERIGNLFKRYWMVGAAVLLIGGVAGYVIGRVTGC